MAARSKSLIKYAEWLASESLLFADEQSPFTASVVAGDPRLVLIVGENASGKSLFFRALIGRAQMYKASPITISIRERSGSGTFEMAGMRRAMMFGEENEQSTGATSVKVVSTGFKNLASREKSVLGLDEPEMGLSDGYAEAFGEYIGAMAYDTPTSCLGVIVVTHSRILARGLVGGFGKAPTFVRLGEGPSTLDEWLDTPEVHSVDELLALHDIGFERWRTVSKLLGDK